MYMFTDECMSCTLRSFLFRPGRRDAAEPASHVRPARPQVPAAGRAAAAALRVGQPQQLVVRAQVERLAVGSAHTVAEHDAGRSRRRVAGTGGQEQCLRARRSFLATAAAQR